MSVTPHRDAAAATCAEARRRDQARGSRGPVSDIANRMDLACVEAVMLGYGELQDLGVSVGQCGDIITRVQASALASFLATVTGGDVLLAATAVEGMLGELRRHILTRLAEARTEGITAPVASAEPRGPA